MASAQFLEEALSTDVDESAVNALVGSLETQLVPATSVQSNADGSVVQNHVNNSISNGGIVQKHGVSNEESEGSASDAGGVVPDGNSNTKQTLVRSTSLAHSTVVNTVVTSLSGLPISQIGPNVITKSSEGVKIVTYPAGNQLGSPQVANINNRVSFPQTITLPNGSIPSSVISSVPSNVQTIVTNSPLNKSLPGAINVIKVDQGQPSGATLVIKAPGSGPMTAGSMTLTQGTPGTTAAPGIVTLAKPLMAGQPVGNTVQILNMNALRPGTPVQGQKGLPQHRVPVVISRPGAPVQPTQITLSALQGLQPGGSGHILVKSESGQLQLIRIGPAPTATPGTPSGTITSNNASQFRIQPLPVQQGTGSAAVVIATTSAGGTIQSSQPPGLTATTPKQQLDTTKEKCRKFLANLLELSSREPKAVERNVRTLIQELIDAKVEPEDFCDRLEKLLNASPQPCLIGFLKKSLPLLRQSLFTREMTIEGIRPPPQQVVNTTTSVAQVPQIQTQLRPQMVTQTVRVVAPLNAAGQNISVTTPRMGTLQNRFVTPIKGQIPAQGKIIATSIRSQTPLATSTQPPPLHHTTPVSSQTPSSPPVHQIRASTPTRVTTPKNQMNKAPVKQVITKTTIQTKSNANNSRSVNVISKPSTPSIVNKSISKVVSKGGGYEELKFGATSFGGDDDINDVAAMGGVNLAEESQRILGSTQFVGTQIRSVKDEIFLHSVPLQNKIRQIVSNHGLDEPSSEVASLVSHACQERLRTLIEKLACIAEHRIDVIKTPSSMSPFLNAPCGSYPGLYLPAKVHFFFDNTSELDSRYEVTQDVKGQLKFLEELDRVERKRHEEQERELLLRAAKSRSKSEDPEQVKLKAKAKEMQRAEMEELRQREANLTALQAIGSRKKPRLDGPGNAADGTNAGAGSGSLFGRPHLPLRPRLKRVNLKDLLFLLEQEKETSRTSLLYKAYLK